MRKTYDGPLTAALPPQLTQTFLLQSVDEPTLWRATSIWKSRDALQEYRQSVETPGGVLLFRSVGVEWTLTLFDIAAHVTSDSA